MDKIDGALEAFADPSFQLLLVDAQRTAASTDRPADYDLLSELLIHRFQKGDNRIARAGIDVAVDIVDKVSDDALLGLTVFHAVNTFIPIKEDACQGLDLLNDLFGKLFYSQLPSGHEWLDHLDVLNAVRLNTLGSLKKVQQYYSEALYGYIDPGIKKDSEDYAKAIEILDTNNLPRSLLIEHNFNADFLRVPVPNRSQIESIILPTQVLTSPTVVIEPVFVSLSEDQQRAVNLIFDLYSKDEEIKQNNLNSFMTEWDKRSNLRVLNEWWDNIPGSLTTTSVGRVLAHSNAQRCDNSLPPLG